MSGLALALSALLAAPVAADAPRAALEVAVRSADGPVAGARVKVGDAETTTDAAGVARLEVPAGRLELVVSREGFVDTTLAVEARLGAPVGVEVELSPTPTHEEEVVVVATTRSGRHLDDEPLRVEVLSREEIEEKMLMTPGDVVMMLNEMGGMRVQATAPSLGAASVRVQGLRGRYTRLLSDGLPLHGAAPGGLGLMQVPPMDLGQVEVVKGVASALYGAGALGGVVNLLSRRPDDEADRELLLNQSTRSATDGVLWLSGPLGPRTGATLLASGHRQAEADVDGDGWADIASYGRGVLRPRLFWQDGAGRSAFATAGYTRETREGGTVEGRTLPAAGQPYHEALDTTRLDAGLFVQSPVAGQLLATLRAAAATQAHDHQFGENRERDRHDTLFAEAALRGSAGRHTWVVGAAIEHDAYAPTDLPQFAYTFTSPGLFAQDEFDPAPWLALSASARVDFHSEYGTAFSPRLSARVRAGGWTSRASFGTGFHAPTPLTEETEAAGLTSLTVAGPLVAERGRSGSLDLGRDVGPVSLLATLFASRVDEPALVDRTADGLRLRNADGRTSNSGLEFLATLRREPWSLTASYTWVSARERDGATEAEVALTPEHSAGLVAMIEAHGKGRLGLEVYVTGRQRLDDDPYRTASEPYVVVGLLAERRFGRVSVFVNGENLTDVRQTQWDPLLRPTRGVDGRWTVDAWAPLEGRVINGGFRVRLGQ
ncbi:MAG: TonB-dependent receptor [Vicinamibacteria bacterium]|nr:TonB-dependent receptor [Vicinamibacteria bacterium]